MAEGRAAEIPSLRALFGTEYGRSHPTQITLDRRDGRGRKEQRFGRLVSPCHHHTRLCVSRAAHSRGIVVVLQVSVEISQVEVRSLGVGQSVPLCNPVPHVKHSPGPKWQPCSYVGSASRDGSDIRD